MSSSHEDYMLRQVRGIAAMLAAILGLRTAGKIDEAKAELEKTYGLLLGPGSDVFRRMDPQTAATLLSSPDAILAFAQLTREEASQQTDAGLGAALLLRALELGIEAARRETDSKAIREFLGELTRLIDRRKLTNEQERILADYSET